MGSCLSQDDGSAKAEDVQNPSKDVTVAILGARNVRDSTWQPTTKCFLCCSGNVPGKDSKSQMTRQVKDLPHPSWKEEFAIRDYCEGDTLEFTLWECLGNNREILGKAYLEAKHFGRRGFCGEIPLELAEEDAGAFLKVMVKCGSNDYPAEPPQEFAVALTNTTRASLGIDFDLQDGKSVFIRDLRVGLVDSYNESAVDSKIIQPGDFIVRVNKAEGNAVEMLEAMKKSSRLELLVRRPFEIIVAIAIPDDEDGVRGPRRKRKSSACTCAPSAACGPSADGAPQNKHGMEFSRNPAGMSLVITKVLDGGPVEEWNSKYPEAEVRPGDRIVALNGEKGRAEDFLRILQAAESFQMHVIRPAAPGKTSVEPAGLVKTKTFKWSDEPEVKEYEVHSHSESQETHMEDHSEDSMHQRWES